MKRNLNRDLVYAAAFFLVLAVGMVAAYYLLTSFLTLVLITAGGVIWI